MSRMINNLNKIVKKSGFTLIELIVVMAISGVLVTIVVVGITIAQRDARNAARTTSLRDIQLQLTSYSTSHNGTYPASISATASTVTIGSATINVQASTGTLNTTVVTPTIASGVVTECGTAAQSGTWQIGYTTPDANTYYLCYVREGGDIYTLNN